MQSLTMWGFSKLWYPKGPLCVIVRLPPGQMYSLSCHLRLYNGHLALPLLWINHRILYDQKTRPPFCPYFPPKRAIGWVRARCATPPCKYSPQKKYKSHSISSNCGFPAGYLYSKYIYIYTYKLNLKSNPNVEDHFPGFKQLPSPTDRMGFLVSK